MSPLRDRAHLGGCELHRVKFGIKRDRTQSGTLIIVTLIDWVRTVGVLVGVYGTVVVMPDAWRHPLAEIREMFAKPQARIRAASSVLYSPQMPPDETLVTGKQVEAHVKMTLQLHVEPIKAQTGRLSRQMELQGTLNGRGFIAIATGILLAGAPEILLPTWVCYVMFCIASVGLGFSLPSSWLRRRTHAN